MPGANPGRQRISIFLILLSESSQEELLKALASYGFLKDEIWNKYNPMLTGTMVRLQFGDVPIDIFSPRDAQEEEALSRRRMIEVDGCPFGQSALKIWYS